MYKYLQNYVYVFRDLCTKGIEVMKGFIFIGELVPLRDFPQIGRGTRIIKPLLVHIGRRTRIGQFVTIDATHSDMDSAISIGDGCIISSNAILLSHWVHIRIGINSFVGPGTHIQGLGGVRIGDNVMVAGHCFIVASNHIFSDP